MTRPKHTRPLTVAEIELIRLVALGCGNEQIAQSLGVKVQTVQSRIANLHHLIGTTADETGGQTGVSRARMTIWAYEMGVVTREASALNAAENRPVHGVPRCGTFPGWQRHRRANEDPCELCSAAKRGYDLGYKDVRTQSERLSNLRSPLAERAFQVCRDVIYKRPWPLIREEAVRIIREADAELVAEDEERAA